MASANPRSDSRQGMKNELSRDPRCAGRRYGDGCGLAAAATRLRNLYFTEMSICDRSNSPSTTARESPRFGAGRRPRKTGRDSRAPRHQPAVAQVWEAEARVAAQRVVVVKLPHGSRPEEIAQARANVESAKADARAIRAVQDSGAELRY